MDILKQKRKLSELVVPEKNVRMHTKTQLREFARSVTKFGQLRPIVVDENDIIRCGVGLYTTLVGLGWEEADTYKVSGLSENDKKKLMIADNKVYALGIDDLENLTEFLESLGTDLDVPGYDEDILRTMVASAEEVTEAVMGYGQFSPEDVDTIRRQGERRDAMMQQRQEEPPAAAPGSTSPNQQPGTSSGQPPSAPPSAPPPVARSIVCPHCGETICL